MKTNNSGYLNQIMLEFHSLYCLSDPFMVIFADWSSWNVIDIKMLFSNIYCSDKFLNNEIYILICYLRVLLIASISLKIISCTGAPFRRRRFWYSFAEVKSLGLFAFQSHYHCTFCIFCASCGCLFPRRIRELLKFSSSTAVLIFFKLPFGSKCFFILIYISSLYD